MYSVTQRISKIKQPRGGYIKRKDFTCITLEDGIELNSQENIHPSLIGLVIDYMTRFCMGTPKETAFHISILGAKIAKNEFVAYKLLSKINGLDTESIISASKLVGYDVCYRAGMAHFKPVSEITPDTNTIANIITMIKRTLSFWEQYGPIIKDGFTFEKNLSYIVRFKACFNLKKGKEPFVMNKTSFLYPFNKALTTSDIYDSKSKKYYSQYLDKNGNIVKSKPTLILTSDDFKLFQELYIVKDLEILDGCYFL